MKYLIFFISVSQGTLAQYLMKDLVESPRFVSNIMICRDENNLYCSLPQKPTEGREEKVLMREGKEPQSDEPYERVLMRENPGMDGRVRVQPTTQWPHKVFGQLSALFSDKERFGSGVLVGPQHVLTCGHKVYNKDSREWAKSIKFLLALNDEKIPFGEARGVRIYVHKKYIEEGNHDFNIALIVLDTSLGLKQGWSGLMHLPDDTILKSTVTLTGYPEDKGAKQMWSMQGKIRALEKDRLFYDIDTAPGQGGSPIWLDKDGESPYVIGVHILAEGVRGTGNSGVRLSLLKLRGLIEQCIQQTFQYAMPITVMHANDAPSDSKLTMGDDIKKDVFKKDYVKK